jgi:hypothetical protein
MFGVRAQSSDTDQLIRVQDDPAVINATERLLACVQEQEKEEEREQRFTRKVLGKDPATDDEAEEAREFLSVVKGTQNTWFLRAAQLAREATKRAREEHRTAHTAASERLTKAGEVRLIALVQALDTALGPARELAQQIEALRMELNEGGVRPWDHPAQALLPHGLLNVQMRNCRSRGWI